jgi:hypothetical protein
MHGYWVGGGPQALTLINKRLLNSPINYLKYC